MADAAAKKLHREVVGGNTEAMGEIAFLAEEGDVIAMVLLAQLHDETGPVGIDQNLELARHWYLKAAELGNRLAQMCFANMCHYGQGGTVDLVLAFKWYRASAAQGGPEAQMHVARFYETGLAGDIDMDAAIHWYEKAIENGHELAATNLGNIIYYAAQNNEDYEKAFDLYTFAAGKGDGLAHLMLSDMNIRGQGTKMHGGHGLLHLLIAEALLPDGENREMASKRKEFYLSQHPDMREEFSGRMEAYLKDKGFERLQ